MERIVRILLSRPVQAVDKVGHALQSCWSFEYVVLPVNEAMSIRDNVVRILGGHDGYDEGGHLHTIITYDINA
jgi:hypothetical protein